MIHKQTIFIRPLAKVRPRVNTKTGCAYTPKATRDYEKLLASLYKGPKFTEGPISVELIYDISKIEITIEDVVVDTPSKLAGDIDNYAKSILDAFNHVAFADDKQVVNLKLEKK